MKDSFYYLFLNRKDQEEYSYNKETLRLYERFVISEDEMFSIIVSDFKNSIKNFMAYKDFRDVRRGATMSVNELPRVYYCKKCDRYTDVRYLKDKKGDREKSYCYNCSEEMLEPVEVRR